MAGVICTYCDSSVPAVKTCLQCESSLCDIHLMVHIASPEHILIEPITSLENRKCPIHKQLLKYYCTVDGACICVSCCLAGEHRGHHIEPLAMVAEKKKETLRYVLEKLTSQREEAEYRVQSLQEQLQDMREKAAGIIQHVNACFRDTRRQMDCLEKKVIGEIIEQEEKVSVQVSDLIQQLEIKKNELSRKIHRNEKLCNMADPLTVLQGRESDNADPNEDDYDLNSDDINVTSDINIATLCHLDEVQISVILQKKLVDIVTNLKAKCVFHGQEVPDLILDENTAANDVSLSGDLKSVTCSLINQLQLDNPERFRNYQVLSTKSFSSGRHYWEVMASKTRYWRVGMTYPSIERKGFQSYVGNNPKSWCLRRFNKNLFVIHNSKEKKLHLSTSCQRFGIFLDYEAGRLSFYQLCDPVRHLYTYTTIFTEPLHAVFWVWWGGWIRIRS